MTQPPPPPPSDSLLSLRTKIQEYLKEILGSSPLPDASGNYSIQYGSTRVFLFPEEMSSGKTALQAYAFVTKGSKVTPELTKFLLKANGNLRFGKFCLTNDETMILFGHCLLGDKMDREELQTVMLAIVGTADEYDDKVVGMAGGKRFVD